VNNCGSWLISGGRILDPVSGRDETADIGIEDGVLAEPSKLRRRPAIIDARGCLATPPLVDIHVHFREPGDEEAENTASGAAAAVRGGFGTVVTMPNTMPPVDTPTRVKEQIRTAERFLPLKILVSACLSIERKGLQLADLRAMAAAGAAAFTDDGSTVPDRLMYEAARAAAELDLPILDHALDPAIASDGVIHCGSVAARLGLPGIPSEAETVIVRRDIAVAKQTGARVHVQHVSAAESVALVREARRSGMGITAEATPHHIALTEEAASCGDANFKMNPPLRTERDRREIIRGIQDGTISVLATDHAPHTARAKSAGLLKAPFGVIGLETALGVTYTELVESGLMHPLEWVRRWTTGPADVLGLPSPSLEAGAPGNLLIINIADLWQVNPARFASRSRNTPFSGRMLHGQPVFLFLGGRLAFSQNL